MNDPDPLWAALRRTTSARIGLGRSGNGLPTQAELEFRAAHAAARDAVHAEFDVATLSHQLADLGLGRPLVVTSQATSRLEYLRRPDLGRALHEPVDGFLTASQSPRLAVVVADGLSALAASRHAVPLLRALSERLGPHEFGPLVIATQARVALGDVIGAGLGARAVLVLIGERPGLSTSDSLGAYLTYAPSPGLNDAQRNCVSNIRTPGGLGYGLAATILTGLIQGAYELGESGVRLKDRSGALEAISSSLPAPWSGE